ncbi:MAG: ABC transporter ATP-binding protein [Candidatus Krumholzibacteriota bacterium]|nr:ABC transporter ATP-binding protein [Candidatus Krumholzibacteriota bacterium]
MATDAIQIEAMQKRYGDVEAVRGITLSIGEGELFGFIGPDGAGKTTLMRSMCTLLEPDGGRILVRGMDVSRDVYGIRAVLGYMPQRFSLYPDLSVEQNMRFFADLFGVPAADRDERIEELYRFSRMAAFRKRKAAALSGGMKQKLALSCALVHRPEVLVLDEPTFGVDPVSRTEFWSLLGRIRADGTTVVVSTAYMDEADRCDRVALVFDGDAIALGTPAELRGRYPWPLFRVTGRDVRGLRSFFADTGAARDIQLFGDSLHVSFDGEPPRERLGEWRSVLGDRLDEWTRIEPSIEDLFLDLLRGDR